MNKFHPSSQEYERRFQKAMTDLKHSSGSPDAAVVSLFPGQILSFPHLLPAANFETITGDSLAEFSLQFRNGMNEECKQKDDEGPWIAAFKSIYHRRTAAMLMTDEFEKAISASLSALDPVCRDLLTWYYADDFSISQIAAITGEDSSVIQRKLLACRIQWQESLFVGNILHSAAPPDEKRFRMLADYFENRLSGSQAVANVAILTDSTTDNQKGDMLELLLRQLAGKGIVDEKRNRNANNPYLSATDFLKLAKEKIQQHNRNKP